MARARAGCVYRCSWSLGGEGTAQVGRERTARAGPRRSALVTSDLGRCFDVRHPHASSCLPVQSHAAGAPLAPPPVVAGTTPAAGQSRPCKRRTTPHRPPAAYRHDVPGPILCSLPRRSESPYCTSHRVAVPASLFLSSQPVLYAIPYAPCLPSRRFKLPMTSCPL